MERPFPVAVAGLSGFDLHEKHGEVPARFCRAGFSALSSIWKWRLRVPRSRSARESGAASCRPAARDIFVFRAAFRRSSV